MRIETFNKFFDSKFALVCTVIIHAVSAILLICLAEGMNFLRGIIIPFYFDVLFLILFFVVGLVMYNIVLRKTIEEDRQNNIPEYKYEYDAFNGKYWTIVKRFKRYSAHEMNWETEYNLINREGTLLFNSFCERIEKSSSIPQGLSGFNISYKDGTYNVLICDGFMYKDTSLLLNEPAQSISNFDSEGMARVIYLDGSVNYVNVKGEKLYSQNLIGYTKSPHFE